MVYDVHATNADGSESRFELTRDEPLKIGDTISNEMTGYTVIRILPDESDQYDEIIEAEWKFGPPTALGYGN